VLVGDTLEKLADPVEVRERVQVVPLFLGGLGGLV